MFFFLLNVFLAFFLYREQRRHTITAEQDQAIFTVFRQNRISGYSRLIRHYRPMRPLAVSGFDYDMDFLLDIFFPGEPEHIKNPLNPNWEMYTYGDIWMVISNGYISYDNPSGLKGGSEVLTRETAAALCDDFVSVYFPNYRQDYALTESKGIRLFYRELYRDYIIHSNFIEFLVTDAGITQVDMQYGTVIELSGLPREIYSPDEALLTFIQRVRSIWLDKPLLITHMDLVYYQEEIRSRALDRGVTLHATPIYRIFIEDSEVPFKIDAYTNVSIN
jgi:hypothetical protein